MEVLRRARACRPRARARPRLGARQHLGRTDSVSRAGTRRGHFGDEPDQAFRRPFRPDDGQRQRGRRDLRKLRSRAQGLGQVVSPDDARSPCAACAPWACGWSSDRLGAGDRAMAAGRPEVARVLCPMLPDRRGMSSGCAISRRLRPVQLRPQGQGRRRPRCLLIDALELFGIGYSWGGFESLVTPVDPRGHPVRTAWPPARHGPCRPLRRAPVDRA
jgi:hypothetical protein